MKYAVSLVEISLSEDDAFMSASYPSDGFFLVTISGTKYGLDKRQEVFFRYQNVILNLSMGNIGVERLFAPIEEPEHTPTGDGELLLRLADILANKASYKDTLRDT